MQARVVVVSLASDFGCQVQLTNIGTDLLDLLGAIDLRYWQLASSGHMPEEYDVAIVEGAVTTREHAETLRDVRERAEAVIAIGSCAVTGGIPALAGGEVDSRKATVYGDADVARGLVRPAPTDSLIEVDYRVPGCPIDPAEFLRVLSRALQGLSDRLPEEPLCAECKTRENVCFYDRGEACLGVMTRTGCGARCVSLGRPCTGCRGIARDANLSSAWEMIEGRGLSVERVRDALAVYNSNEEAR